MFRKREHTRAKRIGTSGYRDGGTIVAVHEVQNIRELCRFRAAGGIDRGACYDTEPIVNGFVNQHPGILNRRTRR